MPVFAKEKEAGNFHCKTFVLTIDKRMFGLIDYVYPIGNDEVII